VSIACPCLVEYASALQVDLRQIAPEGGVDRLWRSRQEPIAVVGVVRGQRRLGLPLSS
jgi:hypothetical protein